MIEQEVEQILIDGSNEIFGGEIYNASYQNNFSDSPSSITISIVNEEGIYNKPTLTVDSFNEPYEIEIGNIIRGNYQLVRTRTSVDRGGKVLELVFWDGSFYLDKIYIGIHKKHGIIPTEEDRINESIKGFKEDRIDLLNKFNRANGEDIPPYYIQKDEDGEITPLIILGREFHPCDTDLDGYLNFEEDLFMGDGCDPCPNCPQEKYNSILDRQKCLDLECSEIFEVRYTFNHLIEAIQEFFLQAELDIIVDEETLPDEEDLNKDYYADYEGSLRDVLRRWCADFGLNFYVESNGEGVFSLKFIDIKVENDVINLDDIKNENILSIEEVESIEQTENLGAISLYKQQGERRVYQCRKDVKFGLKPMTLSDLFVDTEDAILGKPAETDGSDLVSFEDLEISIALGKYSLGMREQFWWGKMYGADGGREEIVKLQYLGPPVESGASSEKGDEINFELKPTFEDVSIWSTGGLKASGGIDDLPPDTLAEIAQKRGILQLGEFKALAFFFPRGRDGEPAEIYYGKGTNIGNGSGAEGKIEDRQNRFTSKILDYWNPSPEEREFFSNTPIFGPVGFNAQSDFETEDDETVFVDSFSRGYFVLASQQEDVYEQILENEANLAQNFIGKFFGRKIDVSDELSLCIYDKNGKRDFARTNFNLKGGGTFYHYDSEETQKFLESPLFSFGHNEDSAVGLLQKKIKDKKIQINVDEENPFDEGVIIQEMANNWFPEETAIKENKQFLNLYENKKIKAIGGVESDEWVRNLVINYAPEHIGDLNVKLFVVYPDDFSNGLDISRSVIHPIANKQELTPNNSSSQSGCYGNCENSSECFQGETDPARRASLQTQYDELSNKDSELGRAILRELDGDTCLDGECVAINRCEDDSQCGMNITIGNKTYSEYKCVNGECVEKLGIQSDLTTRIDVNGFPIFAPAHGFETPVNFKIVNEDSGFDARSYGVILEYFKEQQVFVPKIEHIIQEDIERFDKGYARFNLNLYQTPIEDLNLFYREAKEGGDQNSIKQTCSPSEELLEKLHEEFNKNLSYSIDVPQKNVNITIAGISLLLENKSINVENGLESFSINLSGDGSTSSYSFSNRVARPISIDLARRLIDVLQKRTAPYSNYENGKSYYKTI